MHYITVDINNLFFLLTFIIYNLKLQMITFLKISQMYVFTSLNCYNIVISVLFPSVNAQHTLEIHFVWWHWKGGTAWSANRFPMACPWGWVFRSALTRLADLTFAYFALPGVATRCQAHNTISTSVQLTLAAWLLQLW